MTSEPSVDQLICARYLLPIATPPLEQGALALAQGRVVAVGNQAELLARYTGALQTDFGEALVLPCFVNAHTHLELTDYPLWQRHIDFALQASPEAPPEGFTAWLLQLIRLKKTLGRDAEIYRRSWHSGLQQAQASGTGYLGDIVTTPELLDDAARLLPGRVYVEILGQDPAAVHAQLQRLEDAIFRWPQQHWGIAPHAPYTLSDELLRLSFRQAAARQWPCTIHVAESSDELALLENSSGPMASQLYPFVHWQQHLSPPRHLRPLQAVEQAGGLRPDCLLVHGVHLTAPDIHRIAEAGAILVLCARSNAYLACGTPPVAELVRQGVSLALGTDSLASNSSLSLWDEIAFCHQQFGEVLTPPRLLRMATLGGAQALGLRDIGQLTPGYRASFQVLRPQRLPPLAELGQFLCQPQRSAEVIALYRDGQPVTLS